ncbi:MAG: hypothetical protein LRY54_00630 [Alphaproteobacteria bacterium]|nr:hypothetical protein [Alphaproteobacteria bacterium]
MTDFTTGFNAASYFSKFVELYIEGCFEDDGLSPGQFPPEWQTPVKELQDSFRAICSYHAAHGETIDDFEYIGSLVAELTSLTVDVHANAGVFQGDKFLAGIVNDPGLSKGKKRLTCFFHAVKSYERQLLSGSLPPELDI